MGKKPVLGLVGLCLGLTLTGCKDCNCSGWGWGSRKEKGPAVARVEEPSTFTPISRKRTVQDQTVAGPKTGTPRVKSTFDFPAHAHEVPAPSTETVQKPGIESIKAEEKISTAVPPKPALPDQPATVNAEKKTPMQPAIEEITPPMPPMKTGVISPELKGSAPVEAKKFVFPQSPEQTKEASPEKLPPGLETSVPPKPEPKPKKGEEGIPVAIPVKPQEPAPIESHPVPPGKSAPAPLPDSALPPGPDLTPPPAAPAPPEVKPPMQPTVEPAGESKGGPEILVPPPYTPKDK